MSVSPLYGRRCSHRAGARDGLASAVAGARDGLASAVRLRGELATARLPEPPESIAHTEPVVSAALVVDT